jgi:hypothetical protein
MVVVVVINPRSRGGSWNSCRGLKKTFSHGDWTFGLPSGRPTVMPVVARMQASITFLGCSFIIAVTVPNGFSAYSLVVICWIRVSTGLRIQLNVRLTPVWTYLQIVCAVRPKVCTAGRLFQRRSLSASVE